MNSTLLRGTFLVWGVIAAQAKGAAPWAPGDDPEAPASHQVPSLNSGDVNSDDDSPDLEVPAEPSRDRNGIANYRFQDQNQGASEDLSANAASHFGKLGIMISHKNFAGLLGYEYRFNRYAAWGLQGSYRSIVDIAETQSEYGPLSLFSFRLANPTIVVPFYDYGIGYYAWFWRGDQVAHKFESAVQVQHAGINMQFAQHFNLVIQRSLRRFLNTEPDPTTFASRNLLQKERLEVMFEFTF